MATIREATTQLFELYELRNEEAIANYLFLHPGLVGVLKEARQKIDEHFGLHARPVLELVRDPEGGERELFVRVGAVGLSAREARERLRRMDFEWWLGKLPEVGNLLNIILY